MIKRKRLVWQIYPFFLLITVISVAAVTWYASNALRHFFLEQASADLRARGHLLIEQIQRQAAKLDPAVIDDVIVGCAMPEAEQGMNVARIAALRAGLPVEVPAMTMNRFCSSGLQTLATGAAQIGAGFSDVVLSGGVESMTMVPMGGQKPSPNPWLAENFTTAYESMGITSENVAARYCR